MSWKFRPTLLAAPDFNADADSLSLYTALQGTVDEKTIVKILTTRTTKQRQEIACAYKTKYGTDIVNDFDSKLCHDVCSVIWGDEFRKIVVVLMLLPNDYLANELERGFDEKNDKIILEIICSRTREEIEDVSSAYKTLYNMNLSEKISTRYNEDHTPSLSELLKLVLKRAEEDNLNEDRAKEAARNLSTAVHNKNPAEVVKIVATESFTQLDSIFREYQQITGHAFDQDIKKYSFDDKLLLEAILTIVHCALNRPAWYAMKLYESMEGIGTRDRSLIRLVVSRCETDLESIKNEYESKYKKTLESQIKGDTSGCFRDTLLALVNPGGTEKPE